jgi:hypothetical protein
MSIIIVNLALMITTTNRYLQAAKDKRASNKKIDYHVNLIEFICQCYVKLNPNSYGFYMEDAITKILRATKMKASDGLGDISIAGQYYEVKTSYLTQSGDSYNITHIRPWQNINYYLLCFIDCDNDFTPYFYVINKNIINMMKLSYMNGTPNSNMDNLNIELRASVKIDGHNHKVITKHNLLKDTTINSLFNFINEQKKEYLNKNHIVL